MKQITKMSRLVQMTETLYKKLNIDFYDGELETPIISLAPSIRSYASITCGNVWTTNEEGRKELNLSTEYVNRPIENICASILHEMAHIFNMAHGIKDTSGSSNAYHNKNFKETAEAHGLVIDHDSRYGWTITEPSETLIDWIIEHEEIREIEMFRNGYTPIQSTGTNNGNRATGATPKAPKKTHHRKYICPCCGCSVRATKSVNIGCLDCGVPMIEA